MIIDGKKIAEEILVEVAKEVKKLAKPLRLAAILVENSHLVVQPLSGLSGLRKFLELKKKAAEKVGIDFRLYEFPANITTQKLRKEIVGIAKAGVNHGVIIELPLPPHINTQYVLNAIPPEKDVDVLSERTQGTFFVGRSKVLPLAAEVVKQIFERHNIEVEGKLAVIFGYGLLVGRAVSHWLAQQKATVSIINEFTPDPKRCTLNADIIISGVGKPNLIKADMLKNGAVIIDFGISYLQPEAGSQKPVAMPIGDVDFDGAAKRASLITPVPGGVGPIVVASALNNLVQLAELSNKK